MFNVYGSGTQGASHNTVLTWHDAPYMLSSTHFTYLAWALQQSEAANNKATQFTCCALWLATGGRPSYACTLRRVGRQRAVRVEGRCSGLETEDGVLLNSVKADIHEEHSSETQHTHAHLRARWRPTY